MRELHALDALRGRTGLWTMTLDRQSPEAATRITSEVESLGYPALWLPEAWGREAFTSSGLLLASTSTLVVATGIANIWARDAVSCVNGAKTLNAAYEDRFLLGLGVSHQPLVERLRGHEYAAPLAAMRTYLEAMDAAPMHAAEGDQSVARVIAALGPRMLQLGASHADGVHTYLVTPEHTASARDIVGDAFIAVEQAVVLDQDREEFLRRAHTYLEFYTGLENYRNNWRRLGFSDEDFVRGGSDRLCDAMVAHVSEDDVAGKLGEHYDAGADHVCVQVLGADHLASPLEEWRRLAPLLTE
ncbi:MAG TPA: LLM class F420-dependent oxidoreductase [Acidimicrobiales bacterium]|nr:LLM class F420-dependent oxidoreductase [Acidimicrobiales bacterium]